MSHHECDDSVSLASLLRVGITEKDLSSSDKSEVVVASLFDPDEHELIQLSTYPMFIPMTMTLVKVKMEVKKSNNRVSQRLVSYSNSDDSADQFDLIQTPISSSTSKASPILRLLLMTSSVQLKRRQKSAEVKLHALKTLEKNGLDV